LAQDFLLYLADMAGATLWEKYAHICMSLEPIKAIVYLMHLCIEIVNESESKSIEDSQISSITAVARAYMTTMGYRVMTLEDYERAISFSGIVALWKENNNFQTITIQDLIFHCHGHDYLEHYKWHMIEAIRGVNRISDDEQVQEFEDEDEERDFENDDEERDFEDEVHAWMVEPDTENEYYARNARRLGNDDDYNYYDH
jgi:hypothetical protein